MENSEKLCACGSGIVYAQCCGLFHKGLLPGNALELMRSRYTAYALNIPSYIIQTTHLQNPQYSFDQALWTKEISEFSLHTQFKKLEIVEFKENGSVATVTFKVYLLQNGKDLSFSERSCFEKVKGKWLYRSGQKVHS